MKTTQSETLFARVQTLFTPPGNSVCAGIGACGGTPRFIQRADEAYLWDADGNRYIDYVLSWVPMILGHAHPRVAEELIFAIQHGTSYGAPTALENQVAEKNYVPHACY